MEELSRSGRLSGTYSTRLSRSVPLSPPCLLTLAVVLASFFGGAQCIRLANRIPDPAAASPDQPSRTAVFALGSFWRSEAVFGCLDGIVRAAVGYAGGSKPNPEYRSLRDHAECVQVEYDPRLISYRQLMDVFWSSHDSRQLLGQGPDVGNQSVIFTNGHKSKSSVVITQIQHLETFYHAEPEHQTSLKSSACHLRNACTPYEFSIVPSGTFVGHKKFELKQKPLLQLMGNLPEEELQKSSLAAKLNSFAAELCPPHIQKQIDAKIGIIRKKLASLEKCLVPRLNNISIVSDDNKFIVPFHSALGAVNPTF